MRTLRQLVALCGGFLVLGIGLSQQTALHFNGSAANPIFELRGWTGASPEQAFSVYVDSKDSIPPLTGSYRLHEGAVIFEPRYPLRPGLRYRAEFHPSSGRPLTEVFEIPKADSGPATFVEQIYPTSRRLPENLLKLYLHFSAPMSRGEAYRRTKLLDDAGNPINLAFLELEQELWDPEGKRLTLLFDPGRVKRDLLPNLEVGSPLREGRRYTLVIDRNWPDATGRPLGNDFRKDFEVGPPDHEPPNTSTWKLTSPKAGSRDALVVQFPESMDQALLVRVMRVTTPTGLRIPGVIQIDQNETLWTFRPEQPWKPGEYRIDVETLLEDLAGNSLDRPFEVDVFEKVEDRVQRVSTTLTFTIVP